MKLYEIFDTKSKNITGNSHLSNRWDLTGTETGGIHSHVVPDTDPHMINKISHNDDPAYKKYVRFLANSKLAQQNPHFPRIYEDKTYLSTKTGQKKLWKMEKLPFTYYNYTIVRGDYETSLERIRNLADLYIVKEYSNMFDNVRPETEKWEQNRQIIDLSDKLFKMLKSKDLIGMESYAEALEIIMQNNRKIGFVDLHDKNIMVRLSGQGPQLVFTDPYS
jgi:hypothetical protein